MDTLGIGTALPGALNSAAAAADAKLADNFDTFLTLLTTQLQHQDPLEPMDANQFTEQLVQFSQVEQSIASNKHLEQLLAMVSTNSTADAVSYLGKQIEASGDTNMLSDGAAEWSYLLPENAESTVITIADGTGKLVYSTTGKLEAGTHGFTWDGKDSQGTPLPDGAYTISVTATNASDQDIAVQTYVSGVVDSIQSDEQGVVLMLRDVAIPATAVRKVSTADEQPPAGA